MVVLDAKKDPRFKSNPLVLGAPFIRFYAGAAIYIEDVKIGSFCIIDDMAREEFSAKEQISLMDIASIVTKMITIRRKKLLDRESDLARLGMSIVFAVKPPLQSLTDSCRRLSAITTKIQRSQRQAFSDESSKSESLESLVGNYYSAVEDMRLGIQSLLMLSESSISLGLSFVNHDSRVEAEKRRSVIQMEKVDILQFLQNTRDLIQKLHPAVNVQMSVYKKQFTHSAYQVSYPDLIRLLMISAAFSILREASSSSSLHLSALFVESSLDGQQGGYDQGAEEEQVRQIHSDGLDAVRGRLVILFAYPYSKPIGSDSASAAASAAAISQENSHLADYSSFDMRNFDTVLSCIGGSYKVRTTSGTAGARKSSQGLGLGLGLGQGLSQGPDLTSPQESPFHAGSLLCHELGFPCIMPAPRRRPSLPVDPTETNDRLESLSKEEALSPHHQLRKIVQMHSLMGWNAVVSPTQKY